MKRREFLAWAAQTGVSLSALACRGSDDTALSSAWGEIPSSASSVMPPASVRPDGVLELYLMGGLNPWDTFYVVPEYGKDTQTMWWTFQDKRLPHHASVPEYFDLCDGAGRELYEPFGVDSAGRSVNLGPWVYPFRDRPDILARMRIMVMRHLFEPHGVASPLALCGHPRGTPRMACTGAHVQRYMAQFAAAERRTPHSYVLYSMDSEIAAQFDIHSASSTGLHPASVQPLSVRLTANSPLPDQLARKHLSGMQSETDDAVSYYLNRFMNRLQYAGYSKAAQELRDARQSLRYSGELVNILTAERLAAVSGQECGFEAENGMDTTAMGLGLGVDLLTRSDDRAKHVTVVDSGLVNALGAGYDTHDFHVKESSRNVVHMARLLSEKINKPDEADPNKLDLNKHTILLTSEFGRTPYVETGKEEGLDHWPFGYVVVAIGGIVGAEQKGVVGAIDNEGYADPNPGRSFTPSEFRASVLMSMGIWPFANEAFAVGDVNHGWKTREEAAAYLTRNLWGYDV